MASTEIFYRSVPTDVDVNDSKREVEGIAVPYGVAQPITPSLTEMFVRGAFAAQLTSAHRTFFTRGHTNNGGTIIGKAVELRESDEGLIGVWRVSATPAGDETLTLLRDGVLSGLSIGFRTKQNRREGNTTVRVSAHLVETSVVDEPAYGELSTVTDVRSVTDLTNHAKAAQLVARIPFR